MAKRVKFPLTLKGVPCNTLETVKENFDIKEMIGYFHDKRLLKWLNDRALDEEAEIVEKLSIDEPKFVYQLAEIFEVELKPEDIPPDILEEIWLAERKNLLRQYTDDNNLIDKAAQSAINQEELADVLNEDFNELILVNNNFRISTKRQNKTYIGVGKVTATVKSDTPVDFDKLNIKFVNVKFDDKKTPEVKKPQPPPSNEIENIKRKIIETTEPKVKFELLKKVAELGDIDSMIELGEKYFKGIDTSQDYKKAIYYLERAAELENVKALKNLGMMYNEGTGVKRDNQKAFEYYKKAAKLGDVEAMKAVAKMYEWGAGVDKDIDMALEWSNKAGNIELVKRLEDIQNGSKEIKKPDIVWGDGEYNPNDF